MKNILVAIFCMMLCGCQSSSKNDFLDGSSKISFSVIQVEQVPISRSALEESFTTLNYYRYTDNKLTNSFCQTSDDSSFGTFSDEMPWGNHELFFIGHKNEITGFSNGIASFDKVSDTFSYYLSLSVDENTETEQTFTLSRRVAKFELLATDAIPEWLGSLSLKITGGSKSLNVRTGVGGTVIAQEKTIQIPGSILGTSGNTFSSYVFLPDGTTTISIEVVATNQSGEEIVGYLFEDVVVKTNYITRYKGKLFGKESSFEISADSEWEGTNEYTFN